MVPTNLAMGAAVSVHHYSFLEPSSLGAMDMGTSGRLVSYRHPIQRESWEHYARPDRTSW
jgi:hypothetical protein